MCGVGSEIRVFARCPRRWTFRCQHVIERGNNREACLYCNADSKAWLALLKQAAVKHQVAIHAFVLMTNHVHMLATPADE